VIKKRKLKDCSKLISFKAIVNCGRPVGKACSLLKKNPKNKEEDTRELESNVCVWGCVCVVVCKRGKRTANRKTEGIIKRKAIYINSLPVLMCNF
jgi:hypothetical protein